MAPNSLFSDIDWTRPWLAPFRMLATPIIQEPDWLAALNLQAASIGLRNHRGLPIQFVPQASLPHGMAYEGFISATGGVPTRENLHDFFNALVWLTFPAIKVQLNALQAAEIEKAGNASDRIQEKCAVRGKVRDAATIFDENAALLVVRDPAVIDDLRMHRWHEVFVTKRAAFERDTDVWLFGHALMEKLVTPFKAITAHVWPIVAGEAYFGRSSIERQSWVDKEVATMLKKGLSTSCFTPLPVLGVPGWVGGQTPEFYADASVFRPKRGLF